MLQQHHAVLGVVSLAVVGWYAVGLVLFVPAARSIGLPLSQQALVALNVATWMLFAVALFCNVVWALYLRTDGDSRQRPRGLQRLSDGAWRTDVLLRLALSIAVFSLVIVVFFADADSALFEWQIADRRLFTPLTTFQLLFCPVVLAPLYFFLFFFAAIGRSPGNVIKRRHL